MSMVQIWDKILVECDVALLYISYCLKNYKCYNVFMIVINAK